MEETLYELGQVKLVQLQPNGLIIKSDQTPTGYFYDETRLVKVDQLTITSLGIEATTHTGEHVLDIHHINHPNKEYDDDDLICIGFTSHYEAMRGRFGTHIVDGIAGENIIIEWDKEVWPEDLGRRVVIENDSTSDRTTLEMVSHANPCQEFSQFALGNPYEKPPAEMMKSTLQFLANGRRGFLLVMKDGQSEAVVKPGDKVFVER
jgi:hypothetical protein